MGARRVCRVESVLAGKCICGELGRKDRVRRGGGCDGPRKWSEVLCGRLGWNGGRNRAQNSREGQNVGMMLGEVLVEIPCQFRQSREPELEHVERSERENQRSRELWGKSEHCLELRVHQVDEFCTAVVNQPTNSWIHLHYEIPVEQTSHVCQPEMQRRSTQRTREERRRPTKG